MGGGQLADEGIGEPGECIVDRITDVTVVDADAVGRRHELDHLPRVERSIDGVERTDPRCALRRDGFGDLPQGLAHGMDAGQIAGRDSRLRRNLRPGPIRSFAMDDPAIDEPHQRVIEAGEVLAGETTFPVKGVQEVEGVVQIDAMGVASIGA